MPEKHDEKNLPERPFECVDCKKRIAVHYTEVTPQGCSEYSMCSDCPELKKHLKVGHISGVKTIAGEKTGLACGDCGTTLEDLHFGHLLGCSHCYEVFGDVIIADLIESKKVPTRAAAGKQGIHVGRSPGETQELSPSLRLLSLNEALDETLKREDYEQAAWLRDQIRTLLELQKKSNGKES